MNNNICEYINEDDMPRKICIRACSKVQAKSLVRAISRKYGYRVLLKNINVLYIDNNAKPVNI